jgi:hypothetical protein
MKICFPVRKQNGSEYSTLDEVMGLVGREPHGSWLAGTNQLWHGGLHVSEVSAPGSVLTAENVDTAVPLQCMAEGEVVAWRLNKDYKTADYNGNPLRYSSTFVLVKSTCKPDPNKENSWLEFYSLYMGLAPLSAFPKRKCMKAKKAVIKHPAGTFETSSSAGEVANISPGKGELSKDARVIILREESFKNSGATQLFGLAKTLNADGEATGEAFWVTLLPEYMTADGEQYAQMPVWMQKAVTQGAFDLVTKPAAKLDVEAGDAMGFLGEDIAPAGKSKVTSCHFSHIEVFSHDARMADFLNNPAGVTSGQKYIRLHMDADLYTRTGEGEQSVFTKTTGKTPKDSTKILRVADCSPFEDAQHVTWFNVSTSGWMNQSGVDQIDQYDLKELGFSTLEQEASPDVSKSLHENWVKGVFDWLSVQLGKTRGIHEKQVSAFYKAMVKKIDTDGDGQLSGRELYNALHHPEAGVRDIAARLVVKHDSEWFGGSSHQRWTVFFQNYDRLRMAYAKQWLDDCEWMSQVDAFKSGEPVWHMHPVMFLNAINDSDADEMDLKWLNVPKGQLTFNSEGNDIENSIYFSRHPHVPNNRGVVIGISGVTFGRGLDLGQQSKSYIQSLFSEMEMNTKPLSPSLKNWLLGSVAIQGSAALVYCNKIDQHVPKNEQFLTRKQQHFLFLAVYSHQYEITKRVLAKGTDVDQVKITANIDSYEQDVQDVLVDLTFRGDNSPRTRRYFINDLTNGKEAFKGNLSNTHWKNTFGVPSERFNSRKGFL